MDCRRNAIDANKRTIDRWPMIRYGCGGLAVRRSEVNANERTEWSIRQAALRSVKLVKDTRRAAVDSDEKARRDGAAQQRDVSQCRDFGGSQG